MLRPRVPYLISVVISVAALIAARVAEATLKAIFDVTVQDNWKDAVLPFLRVHSGPWTAAALEWIGLYWLGVGSAFFLMFCVEMMFAWLRKRRVAEISELSAAEPISQAARALLRLRFTGRLEQPEQIASENIQSWFAYWSAGARVKGHDGALLFDVPSSWAVFVTFSRPVSYRQLVANFTGSRPQSWQVRQTLPTVAVITIDRGMPDCEMEIITRD